MLAKTGATELEIADCLGISHNTFLDWQARYPRFLRSLELGRKQSTKRVERALFHRAIGYSHDAVKIFNDKGEPVIVPYREHIAPDTNAAIFWLKNRKPEAWQDRTGLDVQGNISIVAQTLSNARQRALQAKSTPPTLDAGMDTQPQPGSDDTD